MTTREYRQDGGPAVSVQSWRFRAALSGLLLVMLLGALDANIVGPALPRIASDLGRLGDLSWVLTLFLLSSTASTPVYGKLSDLHGRRPMLAVAVAIFLVGSALCGLAHSMPQLLAGRTIQGLGAGGLMTLTQITMSDIVSPRQRGTYQGLFGAVYTLANLGGAPLGGMITELWSWRWIFYVNMPIGLAAVALIWAGLPAGRRVSERPIDYRGILLVSASSTCLLVALGLGNRFGWASPIVLGLVLATIAAGVLAVRIERRAAEPLVPLRMVRNQVWLIATLISAAVSMAVFGAMAFMPLFLQLVTGLSPTMSGVIMAPMAAGLMLSLLVVGRVISRTGRYKWGAVAGVAVVAVALCGVASAVAAGLDGLSFAAVLLPVGAGLGMLMPSLTVALQNAVEPRDIGAATATSGFFRSLAGALGVAIAGAIVAAFLATSGSGAVPHPSHLGLTEIAALAPSERLLVIDRYRSALFVSLIAGAAAAALALWPTLRLPELALSKRVGSARVAAGSAG